MEKGLQTLNRIFDNCAGVISNTQIFQMMTACVMIRQMFM